MFRIVFNAPHYAGNVEKCNTFYDFKASGNLHWTIEITYSIIENMFNNLQCFIHQITQYKLSGSTFVRYIIEHNHVHKCLIVHGSLMCTFMPFQCNISSTTGVNTVFYVFEDMLENKHLCSWVYNGSPRIISPQRLQSNGHESEHRPLISITLPPIKSHSRVQPLHY